ncbi:MAG: PEP-CTERM sorting domain-containing protein [Rhodocyclaceae bacterium]|nr:PEP-CTERM sorting domain-containing protein [Rhodocyclaceae bacterium]
MKLKVLVAALAAGSALLGSTAALATPITINNNYVQFTVSDDGTLGNNTIRPGLIYDPSGTATFDQNTDYVAPGTPFEGFGVRVGTGGLLFNSNSTSGGSVGSSEAFAMTSLTDVSGTVADFAIRWTGTMAGTMAIEHLFFMNAGDERINMRTTVTALSDLVNVRISRAVDPDPDNNATGSATTQNQRGIDANNDGDYVDAGDVSQSNFVGSIGLISGRPLGLFSDSAYTHNTGIVFSCCSITDPDVYLAGGHTSSSTSDHGIGIAFNIGDLAAGEQAVLNYAYVMGGSLATIDLPENPTTGRVPEPGVLALLGAGLFGLMRSRRRS